MTSHQHPITDITGFYDEYKPKWVPQVTFATPGDVAFAPTFPSFGTVTRFGRIVVVEFDVLGVITFTTAVGALQIMGCQVKSTADANYLTAGSMQWGGINKAGGFTEVKPVIANASQIILVNAYGMGVAPTGVVAADVPSGGTLRLRGQITFRIDR